MDVRQVRLDTPGCMIENPRIFLNSAGAALSPSVVSRTVEEHLRLEQYVGGYEAAETAAAQIKEVYKNVADLIGAEPDEVSCSENATRAWELAFYTLVYGSQSRKIEQAPIILTTASEYGSNQLAMAQIAGRVGARVEWVENEDDGTASVVSLRSILEARAGEVFMVCLCWVPTNGGLIQPAAEFGKLCREYGVPFLLDACQAVGQLVVDVRQVPCDALCATGRKFLRGPRGIGFLYVRRGSAFDEAEPFFVDVWNATLEKGGYSYQVAQGSRRFETWERPLALWLGLGAAVRYASDIGMASIESRVRDLGKLLRDRLRAIPGVTVLDLGLPENQCGIVSFNVSGIGAVEVKKRLLEANVSVSASKMTSTMADMEKRGIEGVVRSSVHYYNMEEEILHAAEQVRSIAHDVRG